MLVAGAPSDYSFCHPEDRTILEAHQVFFASKLLGGPAIKGSGDDGQIVKPDEPRVASHFTSKDQLPKEVKP